MPGTLMYGQPLKFQDFTPIIRGGSQMMLGAAEMKVGMGLTLGTGGIATPVGWGLITHGMDQMLSRARTAFSGNYADSVAVQVLRRTGLSSNTSNLINDSISTIATMGGQAMLNAASWKMASYVNQMALKEHVSTFSRLSKSPVQSVDRSSFEQYKTMA